MKSTARLFLIIALFCSVAFADGEMPSGGKTCTENCSIVNPPVVIEDTNQNNETPDSILTIIEEYLFSIFG